MGVVNRVCYRRGLVIISIGGGYSNYTIEENFLICGSRKWLPKCSENWKAPLSI